MEFINNPTKRVVARIKPNHFLKAYGFNPNDSKNRVGPAIFEFATAFTTFSGVSCETTWNNTNVVGAMAEYVLLKASIKRFDLLTVGDDIVLILEKRDLQAFKE